MMALLLAFLIGVFTGLRGLTPIAVTSWAAYLGWMKLDGLLGYIGSLPAAAIFTLAALGELVADKLPKTPSRTAPPGLISRTLMGALTGACVASAGGQNAAVGAGLGVAGAMVGTFGGYQARTRLVKALGVPDLYVALAEDLVAIAGSLFVVSRF
jgi:uncharacterized membrane protein